MKTRLISLITVILSMLTLTAYCDEKPTHQPMSNIAPMIKRITPAIVNITVKKKIIPTSDEFIPEGEDGPLQKKEMVGLGSGVILDADHGVIVTNAHVIDHAKDILVTLKDGRHYRAVSLGEDDGFDIAVIQIKAKHLSAIALGDSDNLQVGNFVAAIGSPFGLNQTVTYGVISALNRSEPKIEGFQSFIQTDAPINPGNSGGALVNLNGQLIGINTALVGPGANVGIGFAIPSNMVDSLVKQLVRYGKVKRGVLGVIAQNITPSLADAMRLDQTHGAIISEVVPGSPAAEAGIQSKDVLLTINKKAMHSAAQIRNTLGMMRPGTKISIEVMRNQKKLTLSAKVGDPNDEIKQHQNVFLSGVSFRNFSEIETDGTPLVGVLVTNVSETSQAALAGVVPGDVITQANGKAVSSVTDLIAAANTKVESLLLNVDRNNIAAFLVIEKP